MKKKIFILLLLITIMMLSSCSLGGRGMIYDDSEKKTEEHFQQVLEAITNRDKDTLKAMFSQKALSEAEDIDGRMDYLFDLFKGKVNSWKYNGSGGSDTNHYGHKTKEYRSWYTVNTDKQQYLFFLLECTEDTDYPENVGLYTLRVIKAEDEETQFTYWQDMKIPGIYKPSTQNDS